MLWDGGCFRLRSDFLLPAVRLLFTFYRRFGFWLPNCSSLGGSPLVIILRGCAFLLCSITSLLFRWWFIDLRGYIMGIPCNWACLLLYRWHHSTGAAPHRNENDFFTIGQLLRMILLPLAPPIFEQPVGGKLFRIPQEINRG